jgi:ABC-type polysaccharide/polyol phosphate export permease
MRESRGYGIPGHSCSVAKPGVSPLQEESLCASGEATRCFHEAGRMTTGAPGPGAAGEQNWGVGSASRISLTGTLGALGLLAKGCFSGYFLRAPLKAVLRDLLLPAGGVWFFTFLHTDATARGGWPMLAIAGAIWLLFSNSVRHGGMMLWHERWLVRDGRVPAGLLLTAAALVPIALFAVHVSLIQLALRTGSVRQDGSPIEIVFAGGIAAATGLGAGMLAARLSPLRPTFASAIPKLLLASLLLTPVFYRLASLNGLGQTWCMANPLCAATELARAGIFLAEDPPPHRVQIIASCLSAAILCWGLFTLRLPPTAFTADHD